jgi:2,3-bisphosphoglycerate-independent phosphoglycerate mutase
MPIELSRDNPAITPVVLVVLDGLGYIPEHMNSPEARKAAVSNAWAQANTPVLDQLMRDHPWTTLGASGTAVGLPKDGMGNSETGHLALGSGRVNPSQLETYNLAIQDGSLARDAVLQQHIAAIQAGDGVVHLFGLLSDGGVHSHISHLTALIEIYAAANLKSVLHAQLDGRDVHPKSAKRYVQSLWQSLSPHARQYCALGSVGGRFYGMDRDKRWDRLQASYDVITQGWTGNSAPLAKAEAPSTADEVALDPALVASFADAAPSFTHAMAAIEAGYAAGYSDENLPPIALSGCPPMRAQDGLHFFNFRTDRCVEMWEALLKQDFAADGFSRPALIDFCSAVGMALYSEDLKLTESYPSLSPLPPLENTLAQVVSNSGLRQLHTAETEKYPHVTYYFNGMRRQAFEGEQWILVDSPRDVETYNQKPAMSAAGVTQVAVDGIASGDYALVVINYANPDMVGHTGVLPATVEAVERVDAELSKVVAATMQQGGVVIIVADHGNADTMVTNGSPSTSHSMARVPCILVDDHHRFALQAAYTTAEKASADNPARLADIAPTVLSILNLPIPTEMSGRVLCTRSQ